MRIDADRLPPRTLDTMSEAIALSSPSGHMSKRARKAAEERLRVALFGPHGLPLLPPPQPPLRETLLRKAAELRELAARGMKPKAYLKEAQRLEAEAAHNLLERKAAAYDQIAAVWNDEHITEAVSVRQTFAIIKQVEES